MDMESLFTRRDTVWDPYNKVFKTIRFSDNHYVEPKASDEGIAFYSLRSFETNNQVFETTLVVTSKHLCEVLNIVLRDEEITVNPHETRLDPHVLYHHLNDFRNFYFGLDLDNPRLSQAHLAALIYFLNAEYEPDVIVAVGLLARDPPCITFDLLWLIFKPKALVLRKASDHQSAELYRFEKMVKKTDKVTFFYENIHSNSSQAGFVPGSISLDRFEGVKKISWLLVFPFEFCPSRATMEVSLEERGRKYIEIWRKGKQYVHDAKRWKDTRDNRGRLGIGGEGYHAPSIAGKSGPFDHQDLDAIHYQLCRSSLQGYAVQECGCYDVDIGNIVDIVWKEEMFDDLVLDPTMKTIIKGLVSHHNSPDNQKIRDIVPGKGEGLIMLFSGPPGIGKTLTAEAVAEAAHRLSYRISSFDLTGDPEEFYYNLSDLLAQGKKWDIVLLLDEADVFLEQRTSIDVGRNSLISIFLRQLEYYSGILILTTNRVEAFDRALESRIHFNFRFPEMNRTLRKQLWQLFLRDQSENISIRDITRLAEFKLNGRNIRHAVSLGAALARIENKTLAYHHISNCLRFIDPSLPAEWEPPTGRGGNNYASPFDPSVTPRPIAADDEIGDAFGESVHPDRGFKRPRLN